MATIDTTQSPSNGGQNNRQGGRQQGPRAGPSVDMQQRTLRVTQFDERVDKELLNELFMQIGPVRNVVCRSDHAFIEFRDAESVGYALAMMEGTQLYGQTIHMEPKINGQDTFKYVHALKAYELQYCPQPKLLPFQEQAFQYPQGYPMRRAQSDQDFGRYQQDGRNYNQGNGHYDQRGYHQGGNYGYGQRGGNERQDFGSRDHSRSYHGQSYNDGYRDYDRQSTNNGGGYYQKDTRRDDRGHSGDRQGRSQWRGDDHGHHSRSSSSRR